MKNKNSKEETIAPVKRIKVKLNYNTYVTIQKESSLQIWLTKYPEAKIIDP